MACVSPLIRIGIMMAFASPPAFAARVLKPQDVVDAVLTKSLNSERISQDKQYAFVNMEKALGRYDFGLEGKVGYEYREGETLSGLSNPIDKTLTSELTLSKRNRLGGTLSVGYLHQSQSSVLNSLTTQTRNPSLTLDEAYLQWRQHLWANSFGVSDRLDLNSARETFRTSELAKQESTENLVLNSLSMFWSTFVAQTQLKDSLTARKMYKDLIGVVQRRGRFGLDKGGEYAQVMADYADADNKVKTASYVYLERLRNLSKLMQEPINEDIDFQVTDLVPPLPRFEPVVKEKLRREIIGRTKLENLKSASRAADWRNEPTVDLVARGTSTGVDPRASASYSELVAGNKPTYYVGLELNMLIDSSGQRAAEALARVNYAREQTDFKSTEQDIDIQLTLLERKLEQTNFNALGAIEVEKYRSRTVREQEQDYRQGRLPLRDLLTTYRLFFESQTQKVQAIGDYHITLNRMAAERDELVK